MLHIENKLLQREAEIEQLCCGHMKIYNQKHFFLKKEKLLLLCLFAFQSTPFTI